MTVRVILSSALSAALGSWVTVALIMKQWESASVAPSSGMSTVISTCSVSPEPKLPVVCLSEVALRPSESQSPSDITSICIAEDCSPVFSTISSHFTWSPSSSLS